MAVVSIQNLKKSYFISDKGIPILSSLHLEVNSEEIVSVEGASGVGKSTLLNIIGALDDFDSGKVDVCGIDLANISSSEKEKFRAQKISLIFQHHLLLPDFTAIENVMIPLLIVGISPAKAKKSAAEMQRKAGFKQALTRS